MTLEHQLTSLVTSQRLRELGVPQDSLFYWVITLTTDYHISYTEGDKSLLPQERNDFYSAFTVAELGEMLPEEVESKKENEYYLTIRRAFRGQWEVSYSNSQVSFIHQAADTLADAMAKMLIYLLENGLITLPAKG